MKCRILYHAVFYSCFVLREDETRYRERNEHKLWFLYYAYFTKSTNICLTQKYAKENFLNTMICMCVCRLFD